MVVYIAGPVSGVKNYEVAFKEAKSYLECLGHETMCILDCDFLKKDRFSWSDCMKICLEMLEKCDCIVLLNGWKTSVGATIEKAWAEKLHKHIYYGVGDMPPF